MRSSKFFNLYTWLIVLAVFLRILLIFNPGFEADVSFWKSWGLATYDKGIIEGMKVTNNNYPTPFAYTLGSMVWIYSRFANPHDFNTFWSNTNILFLAVSKLYPILADLGIAFVILFIGRRAKTLGFPDIKWSLFGLSLYQLLSLLYILSPLGLIDGAWWGQVDSLGVFTFLLALLALFKRRPFLAGAIYVLAMMTKLQNMIYGPIFFLLVWQLEGYDGLIQAIAGALLSFFGLNIEFVLSRNMDRVLASLTENYDYFPWMSLNAFNLWWIVSGAHGMEVSDKLSVLGLLNAKTVGLLLFSCFYLFAVVRQYIHKKTVMVTFFESLIIVNAAFFLFQSQSHDRYAFPLSVFLLLWVPFILSRYTNTAIQTARFTLFAAFYTIFTLFYFYNLHTALVLNYPNNGLPFLSSLIQPVWSISTSVVLLGLFGVYLFTLLKGSRVTQYVALIVFVLFVALVGLLNKPLITRQPIPLTTFIPYISEQGYGSRQTDRTVQSSFGDPNTWTRLSVQYVYYRKGIGTHANSKLAYNINGQFKTFTTDFGIDTEAGSKGTAVFEIYGDNTLLYKSDTIGRFDMPKHISVPVSNVRNLTLVTTDAGDGHLDDHTDWLNPQLWP